MGKGLFLGIFVEMTTRDKSRLALPVCPEVPGMRLGTCPDNLDARDAKMPRCPGRPG
jgi:hypothetical protein